MLDFVLLQADKFLLQGTYFLFSLNEVFVFTVDPTLNFLISFLFLSFSIKHLISISIKNKKNQVLQ